MTTPEVERLVRARLLLANVPKRMLDWTFGTFPGFRDNAAAYCQDFPIAVTLGGRAVPFGLFLVGKTGCGKTSLAVSAIRVAVEAETAYVGADQTLYKQADWEWLFAETSKRQLREGTVDRRRMPPAWFDTWAGLRVALRAARDGEPELLQALCGVRFLVLDDLAVGELTPWREETLLALLGRVDRGRRTLVTSNLAPAAMLPYVGERVVDRLSDPEAFRVVGVPGGSLRGRKGG